MLTDKYPNVAVQLGEALKFTYTCATKSAPESSCDKLKADGEHERARREPS